MSKILAHELCIEEPEVLAFINTKFVFFFLKKHFSVNKNRDVPMLESAKNYYRTRLFHFRKAKSLSKEQQEELEKCRTMLKYLDKLVQSCHSANSSGNNNNNSNHNILIEEGKNGESNV